MVAVVVVTFFGLLVVAAILRGRAKALASGARMYVPEVLPAPAVAEPPILQLHGEEPAPIFSPEEMLVEVAPTAVEKKALPLEEETFVPSAETMVAIVQTMQVPDDPPRVAERPPHLPEHVGVGIRRASRVGSGGPTGFILQSDVNFRGTRMRAGKFIDPHQFDIAMLLAAGAQLVPSTDSGVLARASLVQQQSREGQDPTFEVAQRFVAVPDNSGGAGVSNPLTSDLDAGGFSVKDLKTLDFAVEFNDGNSGGAAPIDWSKGAKHVITLTANAALSFVAPAGVANLLVRVVQDGVGGRAPMWPAAVRWVGGVAPLLSAAPGAIDIVSFYYNGTNYYGVASLNFA